MNYIQEINAFYDWLEGNPPMSNKAIALWYALMHINNKSKWVKTFHAAISTLETKSGISRNELFKARKELEAAGLINWKQRDKMQCASYTMIPLSGRSIADMPTEDDDQIGDDYYEITDLRDEDSYQPPPFLLLPHLSQSHPARSLSSQSHPARSHSSQSQSSQSHSSESHSPQSHPSQSQSSQSHPFQAHPSHSSHAHSAQAYASESYSAQSLSSQKCGNIDENTDENIDGNAVKNTQDCSYSGNNNGNDVGNKSGNKSGNKNGSKPATISKQNKTKQNKTKKKNDEDEISSLSSADDESKRKKFNLKVLNIFHDYNRLCLNMRPAHKLTGRRKSQIAARLREHGEAEVQKMLETAAASDFLGGCNNSGWRANFDWLFLPTNFVKVLEGNYGNNPMAGNSNQSTNGGQYRQKDRGIENFVGKPSHLEIIEQTYQALMNDGTFEN